MKPLAPKETPEEYATRRARETGAAYAVGAQGGALRVEGNVEDLARTGVRFYAPGPGEPSTRDVRDFCKVDRLAGRMLDELTERNPGILRARLERIVYDTIREG